MPNPAATIRTALRRPLMQILGGTIIFGLLSLASIWATGTLALIVPPEAFEGGKFWKVLLLVGLLMLIFVFALALMQAGVEKDTIEALRNFEQSQRVLVDHIVPSFYSTHDVEFGQLPLSPSVLRQLALGADAILPQLTQQVRRLEKAIEAEEIVKRSVVTYGSRAEGMLDTFFNDEDLQKASIDTIFFMGSGRGVRGGSQSSYRFLGHLFQWLQNSYERKGHIGVDRVVVVAPSGERDHFCAKVLALDTLRFLREFNESKGNHALKGRVTFEIRYAWEEIATGIVVFGSQKCLIAFSLGHEDSTVLGSAVPVALQCGAGDIEIPELGPGKKFNLGPTVRRVRRFVEQVFASLTGPSEYWQLQQNGVVTVQNFRRDLVERSFSSLLTETESTKANEILNDAVPAGETNSLMLSRPKEDSLFDLFESLAGFPSNGS